MVVLFYEWLKWSILGKLGMILITFLRLLSLRVSIGVFFNILEEKWNMPSINLLKTIYINFRCLDISKALRMPIFVYQNTQLISLRGRVEFKGAVSPKLIKMGWDYRYRSNGKTRIRIDGVLIFEGKCTIGAGSNIAVFHNAVLSIGSDTGIWENCLIYCMKRISLGKSVCITFQTSIMDSDFHYMINNESRTISPRSKPIIIGNYVWIGNRANIKKGTVLPDYTTIASSNTLLSKDYTDIPPYSILGGIPAKVISHGLIRVWNNEVERTRLLDEWFDNNGNIGVYQLKEEENIAKIIIL